MWDVPLAGSNGSSGEPGVGQRERERERDQISGAFNLRVRSVLRVSFHCTAYCTVYDVEKSLIKSAAHQVS